MTLKITLNLFAHWKNMEITLKTIYKENHIDNHTEIFSFLFKDTEIPLKNFQRYLFLLFPEFSALL